MKKFFISLILVTLTFSASVLAQDKTSENKTVDVSSRKQKPKLTLQEALKIAEKYIKKEKIDVSKYFLFQVQKIQYGGKDEPKVPCWHFWWLHEEGAVGNYIQILVFMDTETRFVPSM